MRPDVSVGRFFHPEELIIHLIFEAIRWILLESNSSDLSVETLRVSIQNLDIFLCRMNFADIL